MCLRLKNAFLKKNHVFLLAVKVNYLYRTSNYL